MKGGYAPAVSGGVLMRQNTVDGHQPWLTVDLQGSRLCPGPGPPRPDTTPKAA